MNNDKTFAHKSKNSDIENFYKIINGKKKFISKRDEYEFEASYFAMCLLLPKDYFLKMIDLCGGIEKVKTDKDTIAYLANIFNVENRLVEARIKTIITEQTETKNNKKLTRTKTTI